MRTLSLLRLVMARSSLPSPLKSPTAMADGKSAPTSESLCDASEPAPSPRKTETLPPTEPKMELNNPVSPPGMSVATISIFPSPLKSPTAMAMVRLPSVERGELGPCWNVPSPLPRKIPASLRPLRATAKSRIPSPLKSPIAMEEGAVPTLIGENGALTKETLGRQVPAVAGAIYVRTTEARLINRFIASPLSLGGLPATYGASLQSPRGPFSSNVNTWQWQFLVRRSVFLFPRRPHS